MSADTTGQLRERALTAMAERGLNNVEELLEPVTRDVYKTVIDACGWFDEQGGRVGTGVLANEIRARLERGRRPQRSMADQQREYGEQIVAWLREHFPQWNREDGNRTHTAAIACVIRLHHKHGKGGLSVREHGKEIREAVRCFEERYGEVGAVDGSTGEGES